VEQEHQARKAHQVLRAKTVKRVKRVKKVIQVLKDSPAFRVARGQPVQGWKKV
jgi:hypothetical protein